MPAHMYKYKNKTDLKQQTIEMKNNFIFINETNVDEFPIFSSLSSFHYF